MTDKIIKFYTKNEILSVFLIFLSFYAACYFAWDWGAFVDTDSYTRALRVMALYSTKEWAEFPVTYSNYPFGEVLHWTRPFDVLWLAFLIPISYFMDLRDAVYLSGACLTSFFGVLVGVMTVWGLRPYFNAKLRLFASFVLLMQCPLFQILFYFRPDHHALIAFLIVSILLLFLRFQALKNTKYILLMGALGGLLIWVAAEGMIFVYIVLLALFILWLLNKLTANDILNYLRFAFYVAFFGWLVNPPLEGLFHIDNGRLSILYIFILAFTYVAFIILAKLEDKGFLNKPLKKILATVAFSMLFICLLLSIFPVYEVFASPFDEKITLIWARRVSELVSFFHSVNFFFLYGFLSLLACTLGLIFLWKAKKNELQIAIFLFVPLFFYTLLGCFAGLRFTDYSCIFAVFMLLFIARSLLNKKKKIKFAYLILIPLFAFSVWQWLSVVHESPRNNEASIEKSILWSFFADKTGSILSDPFYGPELVWYTGRPVIGTPYHRNVAGIFEGHLMFFSEDQELVRELLLKHKVSFIYIPQTWDGNYFYEPKSYPNRLYSKILTGENIPCWLFKINNSHGYEFHLYQIDTAKLLNGCEQ